MYTEQELTDIRAQIKKRWIVLVIPMVALLVGIIVTLVIRSGRTLDDVTAQVIVDVCSLLIAGLLIGGHGLAIKPLSCYARHLDGMLHGMTHTIEDGTFSHLDTDESLVEGVRYRGMTVQRFNEKGKPYQQLFYFDAEKPIPTFTEGQRLRVTYHDRTVVSAEAI